MVVKVRLLIEMSDEIPRDTDPNPYQVLLDYLKTHINERPGLRLIVAELSSPAELLY